MTIIQSNIKANTGGYKNILVALDGSFYSKNCLAKAVELAALTPGARITGVHVTTSARNNPVLQIIEESKRICHEAKIPFDHRILQGKEYRMLLAESQTGKYDLLVMGYKGEGGSPEEKIGSVCELVVRRSTIDTLVVGNSGSKHWHGPLLAMVDGSEESMEGVWTAVDLGRRLRRPIIIATVFDANYHPVLFNAIRRINDPMAVELSRSEHWKTLAQEINSSEWETVQQDLLDVIATTLIDQKEVDISYILLNGKTDVAIRKFMLDSEPSLLIVGKTGIHTDDASLKLGSLTDKLLHTETCTTFMTTCDMLISQLPYELDEMTTDNFDQALSSDLPSTSATRKILIIDDEYFHREYMVHILAAYGDCDTAEDGTDAVELYEKALASGHAYDLVTLDIEMPVMDGHQTLRAIRAKEKEWDLPLGGRTAVVMVTSLDSQDHMDSANQDGSTHYFIKPVNGEKLLTSIQKRLSLGKNARPRNNKPRRIPDLDRLLDEIIQQFFKKWPDQKLRLFPITNESRRSDTELSILLNAALKRAIKHHWNMRNTVDQKEQKSVPTDSKTLYLRGIYSSVSYGFGLTLTFEGSNGIVLDSIEVKIERDLIPISLSV